MRKKFYKSRLYLIFFIFVSVFLFYIGKIIYLQVLKAPFYTQLADIQHNIKIELKAERGDILDRNMRKFAVDCRVLSVYAVPNGISENKKPAIANKLSKALNVNKDYLLDRLEEERAFIWIKRELDKEVSDKVAALNLEGVALLKEYKRFYPNGSMASHIIGFAGRDDTGLEGLELLYDEHLKGRSGWRWTVRDAKQRDIISEDVKSIPPSQGLNVVLTIDDAIQHIVEKEAENLYRAYKAKGVSIIVMDPHTGQILALANRPSYNLNNVSSISLDAKRNRAVTDIYEPGSVFKIVAASCAIEKGLVGMEQKFFCENGQYHVGGRILHDHRPHGTLTFREVIEKSSNIGVTKIAQIIGKEELYKFIRLFGFGELTGIDLPGEVVGMVRPLGVWTPMSISSVPIGQEIAVTSIQLVRATAVIANGGLLMKPYIVSKITDGEGNIVKSFEPVVVRRVLASGSSDKMKDILKGVVEKGTGTAARLESYTTAGKTGTAQKLEPDGRYSHDKFVASFAGFAPADDPKVAIVVSVDEPRPLYYGGVVAAPIFKNIARDVLRYLKVKPDKAPKTAKL